MKQPMKNLKIALVDDNEEYRVAMKLILDSFPYIADVAESENGLDFLKSLEKSVPDIVFMDVEMPLMNGIDATKRATSVYREMKVIALTFHHEFHFIKDMLEAGASNYFEKSKITRQNIEKILLSNN